MTSEEIKQKPATDLSTNGWLREICLELALLNEKSAIPEPSIGMNPDQTAAQVRTLAEVPEPERVKRAYTKRK
jgi:hypothetical protein